MVGGRILFKRRRNPSIDTPSPVGLRGRELADLLALGEYVDTIERSHDWLRRRVETVEIVDESHLNRRVSLDIDVTYLRRVAQDVGLGRDKRLLMPLASLRKQIQLDLDVRDSDGSSIPVATSDVDSRATYARILFVISKAVTVDKIPNKVLAQLWNIIRYDRTTSDYKALLEKLRAQLEGLKRSFSDRELIAWVGILSQDSVRDLILRASQAYYLLIFVSPNSNNMLVKYRRIDGNERSHGLGSRFKSIVGYMNVNVHANGIGSAQREHTRIVAPDDAMLSRVVLRQGNDDRKWRTVRIRQKLNDGKSNYVYERREDIVRAVIYTSRVQSDKYYTVRCTVRPRRSTFLAPAMFATFVVGALLVAIHLGFTTNQPKSNGVQTSTDAALSLIVFAVSTLPALLTQRISNRFVADLLLIPRLAVLASSIAAILVSCTLSFPLIPDDLRNELFVIAAWIEFSVAAYLLLLITMSTLANYLRVWRAQRDGEPLRSIATRRLKTAWMWFLEN